MLLRASQALTAPQELFVIGTAGLNPHSDPSSTIQMQRRTLR
jgi:hypothetical protein